MRLGMGAGPVGRLWIGLAAGEQHPVMPARPAP